MIAGRRRRGSVRPWLGAAGSALFLAGQPLVAQGASPIDVRGEVFVGSEIERYLRDLQVAGLAPLHPWSVRAFSPGELSIVAPPDSAHPWAGRYRMGGGSAGELRVRAVRPRLQLLYNSDFPYGTNDGPVWAGRGVTTAVEAGLAAAWGPVSLTVAPMAFVAENAGFELLDHGLTSAPLYADGSFPQFIDLPQRFGDGRYAVLDPGQSTLRVDVRGVGVGLSTANQRWGPASDNPLLLGNNGPGFPHVFLGTTRPVDLWVGQAHGRMTWGALRQTPWSPPTDYTRRFFAGAVATFVPRGAPGLELGGSRLFHSGWPEGWRIGNAMLAPLSGVLKESRVRGPEDDGTRPSNQLASVFFRWVHPAARIELWGEFAREDHSYDLRDLLLEPDHYSAYLLGARRVWRSGDSTLTSLRVEFLNARTTHLARVRPQAPFYIHTHTPQGHTHAGQLLGSPAAYGGLGSVVGLDHHRGNGRWSVAWERSLRDAAGAQGALAQTSAGASAVQSLGVERLFFAGRFELAARIVGTHEMNRNFTDDASNLNLMLRATAGL